MDILYLVGNNTICDFADLRFSLRSLEKYGKNVGKVYMCGYIPSFISDEVIKIPFDILPANNLQEKAKNIFRQVIYAVQNSDIGKNDDGEFLISMDDHYLLSDVDFKNYPYYLKDYVKRKYRYMLPEKFEPGFVSPDYQIFLIQCCKTLKELGWTTYNTTLHRNMHANRNVVETIVNDYAYLLDDPRYTIETSLLLNNYVITHQLNKQDVYVTLDFKSIKLNRINNYKENGGVFLSSQDFSLSDPFYFYMLNMFPNKSKYELNNNVRHVII